MGRVEVDPPGARARSGRGYHDRPPTADNPTPSQADSPSSITFFVVASKPCTIASEHYPVPVQSPGLVPVLPSLLELSSSAASQVGIGIQNLSSRAWVLPSYGSSRPRFLDLDSLILRKHSSLPSAWNAPGWFSWSFRSALSSHFPRTSFADPRDRVRSSTQTLMGHHALLLLELRRN